MTLGDTYDELKENWRILMLIVFLVVSGIGVFAPGIGATEGPTNLAYGLDLEGGTRVRAPVVGMYAENVSVQPDQRAQFTDNLANELGVESVDVDTVNRQRGAGVAVEVYAENVTQEQFRTALNNLGYDVSKKQIHDGVTAKTRTAVVNTLSQKINKGGLTGGSVTQLSGQNQHFVVVEVPGANRSEVLDMVSDRGLVEIQAEVKNASGATIANKTVLTGADMTVGGLRDRNNDGRVDSVSVTVSDEAAPKFAQAMRELGFTSSQGIGNCDRGPGGAAKPGSYCLLTVLNGNVVHSNSMGNLAQTIESGKFVNSPTFTIGAPNPETAQDLKLNLQVGSLPTRLDTDAGTTTYIAPSLAQEFKLFALITGLIAWIGVAAVVFLRYQDVKVAIPMLFTAIAEVFILLGFAAAVGLALDLSHIAGLIAVIGTGVDDLVIIADEVLQRGEVATGRVFQSRFRKAFWVIGAAAATTIIAMSPLAVLSLGDLQGFAIVTIAGVLIGVLITRPAYGDILRNLVLDEA